eukprot:Skav221141  [mRNA]  locus=scaffold2925:27553:29919:+ [translate_table: standard]
MSAAGACLFAEVGRSAKGGAAFRTREEVRRQNWAVPGVVGTEFEGSKLLVEPWGRKPAEKAADKAAPSPEKAPP